jgi:nucleotide-binding universal stress UspA family protein
MSTQRSAVVVGVDGSDSALEAARWGAAEAARRHVPLRLVHAFDHAVDGVVGRPVLGTEYRDVLIGQAHRMLAAASDVARDEVPGLEVEEQLVVGYPIPVLVDESRRAELLAVGDQGRTGLAELIAGSVPVALAAHGKCPVAVVRGAQAGATGPDRPIVLGVDGTPASEAAIAFAFATAAARHAPLVAVHAWSVPATGTVPVSSFVITAAEAGAEEILAERLAGWGEKYPDVSVRRAVVNDVPARLLVREAESAQLVVVGSRGHGHIAGIFLGSVGHALVHCAPCPVVVVRPDAERP